jgi:uncharacterized membrane protein HdeD (DUF308 family)
MSNKKVTKRRPNKAVAEYVKDTWWTLLLLAILSVLIGLYAVIFPGATIELFATLFGIVLVICSVLGFVKSLANKQRATSLGIVISVITFVIGIYILLYPVIFVEFLVFLFAIILLIKSIFALQLSTSTTGSSNAWLIVSGIVGIVAATFLFVSPAIGGIAILYILGIYAIIFGVMAIVDLANIRRKFQKLLKK